MATVSTGPIQQAVRAHVRPGALLTTPARGSSFTVSDIDTRGVVLLLGEKETRTRVSWDALEGVGRLLASGDWIPIGGSYSTDAAQGTLDAHLKQHIRRATAGWVAALLEAANVAQIDRRPPARVRLTNGAQRAESDIGK